MRQEEGCHHSQGYSSPDSQRFWIWRDLRALTHCDLAINPSEIDASWLLFIVALFGAEPRGHTTLHNPRYLGEATQDTQEISVSHIGPLLERPAQVAIQEWASVPGPTDVRRPSSSPHLKMTRPETTALFQDSLKILDVRYQKGLLSRRKGRDRPEPHTLLSLQPATSC